MATWKHRNGDPDKNLSFIGTLFETGKVKRMYDIAELYPTKIVKSLGINGERYAVKLASPEKFTVAEILKLAYILNVEPNLIINVIQQETENRIVAKINVQKEKSK
ncbi:hypothetical protein ACHMWN_08475 [Pedobacter sp. UC225_61]|uniref:hypothetical protein n=1 Tax=Pedobacter sp. UC225_61 TaxID=3374623 RepID=UPI0037A9163B